MRDDDCLKQLFLGRIDRQSAEVALHRLQDFIDEIDGHFVGERQRPDRHAGHFRGILDERRRHAFEQHEMAFAQIIIDAAIGEEPMPIVDDDRRLLDGADIIERYGQRAVARLLAEDDFDQKHFLDRRENVCR